MAQKYGWTPDQVSGLTFAQLAAYIADDGGRTHFRSIAEARAFMEARRGG